MEPTIYKPSIYNGAGIYKTGAGGANDKKVSIGGYEYNVVKIGNLLWIDENLKYETSEYKYPNNDQSNKNKMGLLYKYEIVQDEIFNIIPFGWRVPNKADLDDLINASNSALDYLTEEYGGNNSLGFNGNLPGIINSLGSVASFETSLQIWTTTYSYNSVLTSPTFIRNLNGTLTTSIFDSQFALIDSQDEVKTRLSVRLCKTAI